MSPPRQAQVRNRLLALMEPALFERLAPDMQFRRFDKGAVLWEPGAQIERAYFLESGIGSIVVVSPKGLEAEAGLFGREGMSPTALLMGSITSAHRILFQVAGDAWSMATAPFLAAMDESPALRGLLLRYAQTLMVQVAYTALSNAVHTIEERLARWLLMSDDRVSGGELALTHEFLSIMLAVRRPSVTTALHMLEGKGFIRADRGSVTVINRRSLEVFAGDSYGAPEAVYERAIGPLT